MIKVYFQSISGGHSELVATFKSDELYHECLPSLDEEAAKQGCILTESDIPEELADMVAGDNQAVGHDCLKWFSRDFDMSHEKMTHFFENNGEAIIQFINELKDSYLPQSEEPTQQ